MIERFNLIALVITAAVGIRYFNEPLIYVRLLTAFCFLACLLSYKHDKNVFSLFVILFIELTIEEIAWQLSESTIPIEIVFYAWGFIGCYLVKDMLLGKVAIALTTIVFITQIYWWLFIDVKTPEISWYVFILGQLLIVHELVFMRPHYIKKIAPNSWGRLRFILPDSHILDIYRARVVLEMLNLTEYLFRHLSGNKSILIIHSIYPYAAQFLTLLTMWVVIRQFLTTLKEQFFPA